SMLRAPTSDRLRERRPRRLPSTPGRYAPGRRSRVALALVLLGAGLVPVAAATARTHATETISLVAPDYSDKTQAYWRSVITRFERGNPSIAVDLQMVHWTDINQKVATLILSGHVPDILNLDSYANFAGDGSLLPADEVLSPTTRRDFVSVFARNGQYR